jgi:hypothetical protein
MNAIKAILVAWLAVAASVTYADEISVFGFELGKPLALPECVVAMMGTRGIKMYESIGKATCVEDARTLDGYDRPMRRIVFGRNEAPTIVKNFRIYPLEEAGVVIGLHFLTAGVGVQSLVMEQLQEKFGPPTTKRLLPVQNLNGAVFDSMQAEWRVGNVAVTYVGAAGRMDVGEVFIDTPAAAEIRNLSIAGKRAKERKL